MVIASYLFGANGNVELDVERLYGDDGIKEILGTPREGHLTIASRATKTTSWRKLVRFRSMPEILPKSSYFA